MANNNSKKDERSTVEKIQDTLTWGQSKRDRERRAKGLPTAEEESRPYEPSIFSSDEENEAKRKAGMKRYMEYR